MKDNPSFEEEIVLLSEGLKCAHIKDWITLEPFRLC